MKTEIFTLSPFMILVLVGFLPNEVWRVARADHGARAR